VIAAGGQEGFDRSRQAELRSAAAEIFFVEGKIAANAEEIGES
jgi:hypothetical protein